MSAADDLGLTLAARMNYMERLSRIFAEGCAMFGKETAAKLFREQSKAARKVNGKSPPPPKRKGGHDPQADQLLLQLWKTCSGMKKQTFAEMALKNHAVKIGKKVRRQDNIQVRSLVRRLNRLLESEGRK